MQTAIPIHSLHKWEGSFIFTFSPILWWLNHFGVLLLGITRLYLPIGYWRGRPWNIQKHDVTTVCERERERVRVRVRVRVRERERPEGALLALHVICQSGPDCRPSSGNWGDEGMAQMNHLVSIYKVRFPVSYNYLAKYNSFLMEILKIVQVNNCMFNYFVWHYYKPHRLVSLFTIRGIQKA